MRELLNFIQKNIYWLHFILLIIISGLLIVSNNQFQRSKYLYVVNEIAGRVYSVTSNIKSYIGLRDANADLLERISQLEESVCSYKNRLELLGDSYADARNLQLNPSVDFIPGRVTYNTYTKSENYVLINKGSKSGIKQDMGVVSPRGIVGVIMNVSDNYSLAISVLNSKFQLSCKIKDKNYFGPLVWDSKDYQYTYLENLPRHAELLSGDTIITSGYSAFFPEGLPVGVIEGVYKQKDDNYNRAKIKLFTDFSALSNVLVIDNYWREEQVELLKDINN
ncbi:rod shape-determining protein MreC [Dysgonomonadaceae bacterium PH5-43]|nr:rod shape-determining protein MreC [Dysgonomonadaceae bacterium PH5-43]